MSKKKQSLKIYSLDGEIQGETALNPKVFGLEEIREDIVHQAVEALRSKQRNTVAAAKTRGEARGGGRKPWRQKGTGRARAGSIRSPLWKGGGVTFGPSPERNFKKQINKKTKRLALRMALTDRARENQLFVVKSLALPDGKTKSAVQVLDKIKAGVTGLGEKLLLITAEKNDNLIRAVNNLPEVQVKMANSFNIIDVLTAESILVEQPALRIIEETYLD